jgi:hypothetical protein
MIEQANKGKLQLKKIKKQKDEIKYIMQRKGLKPSPLEFIKLISIDGNFANRFCYCNREEDFYEF